jgi:hypothetical protein
MEMGISVSSEPEAFRLLGAQIGYPRGSLERQMNFQWINRPSTVLFNS